MRHLQQIKFINKSKYIHSIKGHVKFVLVIIEYGNVIGLKDSTLKRSAKLFYKMDSVIDVWKEDILQGRVPKPISDVKKHNVANHIIPLCIFTTKKRIPPLSRK